MSNIHPIFDDIFRRHVDGAFDLLGESLAPTPGCTSVSWPLRTESAVCQLPADHEGRHFAESPMFGEASWGEPTGYTHHPEVLSGECDPDAEHDQAKETLEDTL